jgi:ssDNA-binding Zn-finger/Zn-ribbon topoisomerase 1
MQQFNAVNDAMKARTPPDAWRPFLDPNVIPNLPRVPKDLDLIDSHDVDYHAGRDSVRRVYEVLASRHYITDMAASKVCYLKRPSLIAISDSYVRRLLLGPGACINPRDPARGAKYANRGVAVMDAIRRLGHLNADPLRQLSAYIHSLKIDGRPVSLSKARILDILLWVEVAIEEGHPYWSRWGGDGRAAPPGVATTDVACPKCVGGMVRREGPRGPFYGCLRYPECNGTRSLFECPRCGGGTVRREGPKGPFYGCLRYPECRGTVSIQGPPVHPDDLGA